MDRLLKLACLLLFCNGARCEYACVCNLDETRDVYAIIAFTKKDIHMHVTSCSEETYRASKRNTEQCPPAIQQASPKAALAQYGNRCFQFDPAKVIWQEADWRCGSRGGHLVRVDDQAVNDVISTLVNDNSYFPAWIGLHDIKNEEHFTWISDQEKPVTYTNWVPGHHNTQFHDVEDCVVMNLAGQWDDKRCGQYSTVDNRANTYAFVCQYVISDLDPVG